MAHLFFIGCELNIGIMEIRIQRLYQTRALKHYGNVVKRFTGASAAVGKGDKHMFAMWGARHDTRSNQIRNARAERDVIYFVRGGNLSP
jgi:hypothetical protein